MKAIIGMEVHVFTPEQDDYIGLGKIIRIEKLIVEETGEVLSDNFPIIKLINGKEIDGLHCWWCPTKTIESLEKEIEKLKDIKKYIESFE